MSEGKEGLTQPNESRWNFKSLIKKFTRGKEIQQTTPSTVDSNHEDQRLNTNLEQTAGLEISPVSEQNSPGEPEAEIPSIESFEEPQKYEKEKLRPIHKIFFHTTPTRNLPSIMRRGLIGEKGYSNIGREMMYS